MSNATIGLLGHWSDALEFGFMRRALVAAAILGLAGAPLGTLLIQRRMSLVGDAMAHAVLPGAAIAFLLAGLSLWALALGGMLAALAVAAVATLVSRHTAQREDASYAALYLIALALGVLLVSQSGGRVDLTHLLFGSVLAVDDGGLVLVAGTATITWIALAFVYRPLVLDSFDRRFLPSQGASGTVAHATFMVLVVLNLVAGFQVLGTLMSVGLLILPAAGARFWCRRLETLMLLAGAIAIVSAVVGLALSWYFDAPSGPAIVLCAGAVYGLSAAFGPHGGLARSRRWRARPAHAGAGHSGNGPPSGARGGLAARLLPLLLIAVFVAAPLASAQQAPPVRVVASFSILGDLVTTIGGDQVVVDTLVGADADAHIYEPTPADVRAVQAADLLVVNGLGFEGWMSRLRQAAGFRGTEVVATRGVQPRRDGTETDPHAWQDARNVAIYIANITHALGRLRPQHAPTFERRAREYGAALAALHADARRRFAAIAAAERQIVTSHDAFGYFADAFDLRIRAPQGWSTDDEPSAREVAALIGQLRSQRVRAVFVENIVDPRLMQRIATEAGATVGGRLYSDALSAPTGPAPTYLRMMRHNVDTILAALSRAPERAAR